MNEREGGRQAGKKREKKGGRERYWLFKLQLTDWFLTANYSPWILPILTAYFFLSKHEKEDSVSLYCISYITFIHVEGFVNAQGSVHGCGSETNIKIKLNSYFQDTYALDCSQDQ